MLASGKKGLVSFLKLKAHARSSCNDLSAGSTSFEGPT